MYSKVKKKGRGYRGKKKKTINDRRNECMREKEKKRKTNWKEIKIKRVEVLRHEKRSQRKE